MSDNSTKMLHSLVSHHTGGSVVVHMDGASTRGGLAPYVGDGTDKHGSGEYVGGMAVTIGIGSFWSTFRRSKVVAHHKIGSNHLHPSWQEFVGWRNVRALGSIYPLCAATSDMAGHRPMFRGLIAENGLGSRAKP